MTTDREEEHRRRHVELHHHLDELVGDYLTWNRNKVPSNTTVMELIVWSHQQTLEPSEGDPPPLKLSDLPANKTG